jgi:hypothetical protein
MVPMMLFGIVTTFVMPSRWQELQFFACQFLVPLACLPLNWMYSLIRAIHGSFPCRFLRRHLKRRIALQ